MKGFIKWMDNLHWLIKLLLCIPALDVVWAVYRIVKGVEYHKLGTLIVGILWIVPGIACGWIIDIVCTLIWRKPILFA